MAGEMDIKTVLMLASLAGVPFLLVMAGIMESSTGKAPNHSGPDMVQRATVTATTKHPSTPPGTMVTLTPTPSATPAASPEVVDMPAVAAPTRTGTAPRFPHREVAFIRHGSRQVRKVALTFDLCQRPENPAGFDKEIVEVLLNYQAPATFFVGGHWAVTHPRETQWLASIPLFEIGNHSWTHPDLPDLTEEEISQQILRTQDALWQLTGVTPRLFRLPAGKYNDLVLSVVAWHGLYTIQWDVDTGDPVFDTTPEVLAKNVRDRTQNGSIILMHANGRGWHTAEALPSMIEFLRGQGYELVKVSELIGLASPSSGEEKRE
jgi:peptidoglycan/xylan/chitin deacetylase (PgdA/CDA1 family)